MERLFSSGCRFNRRLAHLGRHRRTFCSNVANTSETLPKVLDASSDNKQDRIRGRRARQNYVVSSSRLNQLRKLGYTLDPDRQESDYEQLEDRFAPQTGPLIPAGDGPKFETMDTDRGSVTSEFVRFEGSQNQMKVMERYTKFRYGMAAREARSTLPTPASLSDFSDKSMTRYWSHRLGVASKGLAPTSKEDCTNKSVDDFWSNFSPALRLLAESSPEEFQKKYPTVYAHYLTASELSSDSSQTGKLPSPQFPFQPHQHHLQRNSDSASAVSQHTSEPNALVDTELETFRAHHHLMQYVANEMGSVMETKDEYESEIKAWQETIWRRNYGTPDPNIPPSATPCAGCGAHLHCVATNMPGYIAAEKFKNVSRSGDLKSGVVKCTRCELMAQFNIAINVTVPPDLYPNLIARIRTSDPAPIVILMVDLLDFPSSIWPGIIPLITGRTQNALVKTQDNENQEEVPLKKMKIHVVGNKVDLLPKDSESYLEGITASLQKTFSKTAGVTSSGNPVRSFNLISAKTGYGIERLITHLLEDSQRPTDIFLLGPTNVGKSSLFNALLQSDLCALRENDLLTRATASPWPGTTLNLLKFPIRRPTGIDLDLRRKRLRWESKNPAAAEARLRSSLYRTTNNPQYATLVGHVGQTFCPASNVPFTVESGHPHARRHTSPKPFDPNDRRFSKCNFFYDTPGTIFKDQILTLLTAEEILLTIPRAMIVPRSFTLRPGQSLFIGGLARVDVEHSRRNVLLTAFASPYLPCHVTWTTEADNFYHANLGTDLLKVPIGLSEDRLKFWPALRYRRFDVTGSDLSRSAADLTLSSVGWVGVAIPKGDTAMLKAWTPEGRGIHLRDPPLLPYAHQLRGKWIRDTPLFENESFTYKDLSSSRFRDIHKRQKTLRFNINN